MVDVLYNSIVGANLMSASYVSVCFGKEPHAPTCKSLRIAPCSNLKGRGILHNMIVCHGEVVLALDFHVFDIRDFDIMIGHPLEKLFVDPPTSGELDIKLGRDTFSIPIT